MRSEHYTDDDDVVSVIDTYIHTEKFIQLILVELNNQRGKHGIIYQGQYSFNNKYTFLQWLGVRGQA